MIPEVSWTLSWRLVFGIGADFSMLAYNLKDKLKVVTLWMGPLCVCFIWDPTKTKTMKLRLIYWKASALVLSWALLGVVLKLINMHTEHLDQATWGAICVASAAYLIGTTALLKPFTK